MRAIALLAMACAVAFAAHAQVLYKWVDAQGRTQYSDAPPKGFKGEVTRIEVEPPRKAAPIPPPPVVPVPAAKGSSDEKAEAPQDLAARRKALREKLQANLDAARLKLELAQKALDEGRDPQPEERQAIQQRVNTTGNTGAVPGLRNPDATQNRPVGGGMHGLASRSNCRTAKGADGRDVTICPTSILKEEYFDRVAQLEEAVRKAEEEVAAAESAYRRGVD